MIIFLVKLLFILGLFASFRRIISRSQTSTPSSNACFQQCWLHFISTKSRLESNNSIWEETPTSKLPRPFLGEAAPLRECWKGECWGRMGVGRGEEKHRNFQGAMDENHPPLYTACSCVANPGYLPGGKLSYEARMTFPEITTFSGGEGKIYS